LNSKNIFTAELRKILTYKEELLTNMKNMLYRCTDNIERLQTMIADTEQQFADCLQQIKTLGKEKEQRQKELEDLQGAAQKLVDMVDPQEGGEADERPLLERLLGAPQKVLSFLTEALIACVLSVETHRRATTGNTRSREASGTAGGPRSLGQRPSDLARTLAWSC
jgi:hypothetical protein